MTSPDVFEEALIWSAGLEIRHFTVHRAERNIEIAGYVLDSLVKLGIWICRQMDVTLE